MNTDQIMALVLNYAITLGKFKEQASDANTEAAKSDISTLRYAIEALVQERDALQAEMNAANTHFTLLSEADNTTIQGLIVERDTYQVAADKLAAENKALRDALEVVIDSVDHSDKTISVSADCFDVARQALTRSKS